MKSKRQPWHWLGCIIPWRPSLFFFSIKPTFVLQIETFGLLKLSVQYFASQQGNYASVTIKFPSSYPVQRPSEEANSATFEHRTHSAWAPPSFLVLGPVRKVSVRLCWGLGTSSRARKYPWEHLGPNWTNSRCGDIQWWVPLSKKMKPDRFIIRGCPEYTQHILQLIPRNVGLPCCILFQWTTWKFGKLFYSHYKTYKQFKQITAIFKWMSAMLKIRTVIFMNRLVDCPLPLHPSASVLANLRKISDSSLPSTEYFTSQELLKERMLKMSCKSRVACLQDSSETCLHKGPLYYTVTASTTNSFHTKWK